MFLKTTSLLAAVAALTLGTAVQAEDNAVVKGTVKWGSDKTKEGKKIDAAADPYCAKLHAQDPLRSEKLVFNNNQTLKNIFVYVAEGLPAGRKWQAPATPVVLDQKGCHYEPHVFGVMAGQEITIRNSDDTAHNINASPKNNSPFNNGQAKKGMEFSRKFDTPEIMVPIKCDVHPWMSAFCAVMDHPFFATTGDDGTFELKGLPAGTYTIKVWHESEIIKTEDIKVTVGAGETKQVEIVFSPTK